MPARRPDRPDGVQHMEVSGIPMDIRRLGATAGLLGAAALVAALGAGPLLVDGRGPSRRTGREGRQANRHHRRLRLRVAGRHDARPEHQSPDEPRGHRRCAPSATTALYQFLIDTNARREGRHRLPPPVLGNAVEGQRTASIVQSYVAQAGNRRPRPVPTASRATSSPRARRRPTASRPRSRRSAAAARPSSARATIRSSSTCPGFVEFKEPAARRVDRPRRPARRLHRYGHVRRHEHQQHRHRAAECAPGGNGPDRRRSGPRPPSGSNGRYVQVDRMARPAINTVFNHTGADKDAAKRPRPGR